MTQDVRSSVPGRRQQDYLGVVEEGREAYHALYRSGVDPLHRFIREPEVPIPQPRRGLLARVMTSIRSR